MSVLPAAIDKVPNWLKWAITLTAPIWILPVGVVFVIVLMFAGIHDSLWNRKPGSGRPTHWV